MSKTISAVLKEIASFKLESTDSELEIFFSDASRVDLFRDLLDMASSEYEDVTDYMHEYKVSRNKKTKITTVKLTLYQVEDWIRPYAWSPVGKKLRKK